jgi:hypothetical protein
VLLDPRTDFRHAIGEDPEFRRRFWRVQNAGLVLMGLFLFAGALGVLGGAGPLASTTSVNENSSMSISHPRFLRNRAPVDLEIHLPQGSLTQPQAEIEVNLDYIRQFDILHISPEPTETRAGAQSMVFVFEVIEPEQAMLVTFHMQPERFGFVTGNIGLAGEPAIEVRQLIYP